MSKSTRKKLPHKILAEGEATGHAHRATARTAELFDEGGTLVLSAPRGTKVVHEEHGVQEVPAGEHVISRVQEFDPFAEEVRAVQD